MTKEQEVESNNTEPDSSAIKLAQSMAESLSKDVEMTGTLTVEKITVPSNTEEIQAPLNSRHEIKKAIDIPLLETGIIFKIENDSYKVVFVNVGQRRFTCIPHLSKTHLPELNTRFMLNGSEYQVGYVNLRNRRFSCVPYKGDY